ncbi:S1C family serine protease [Desulfopila inferna]|uniref:S1C family serine protease n=1 Tax=Desulfopila inferna TaxID=468528 RepID=UPI0019626BFC|nr:trypsin-like peptidase domain-containing protein [Desulfopila inferna]MBM9602923.1 trypsin-like peptidase domain-containing protein [Desulfopila inferna]
MKRDRSTGRVSPFALLLVFALGLWFLFNPFERINRENAEPRAVMARGDLAEDESNTIEIFKNTSSSVVYITSKALRRNLFSLNAVEIPQGTGSGIIWDKSGRIVTNFHVISDATTIQVTMSDQSQWDAVLLGAAPDKDLAVLQIRAPERLLRPIPIGETETLLVGQKVFAIGNPFGLDQTMTSGIISALDREIKAITGRVIHGVIQTDAAINPGNSGGPLLDSAGRLIGINTAIFSPSGAYAGIGFAVPVEEVNKVIPQLIKDGRLIKPGLGVSLTDNRIAGQLGIEGLIIVGVNEGSGAQRAGLRPTRQYGGDIIIGDIIKEIDGKPVRTVNDIQDILETHTIGENVPVTIERNKNEMVVQVELSSLN